jgi:hypothetical protein
MNIVEDALLFVSVIGASTIASYAVNVSRERLWLRSKKTEDIYFKADELGHQLSFFFKSRYDLVQLKTSPRESQDIRALNRQLSELNVLVGLYLPALGGSLSAVLAATSSAFHWLGIAETSTEVDKEHAFHSLDFAVCEIKSAVDNFKKQALCVGSVDGVGKIYDLVLNYRRRVQANRILAHSA